MLTIPYLLTSTMRDLMRYPRHHPSQHHPNIQQLQQQQTKHQEHQATTSPITNNTPMQAPITNTTPLCPKPQPTPLRPDQIEVQAKLEQHQQQLQQQQQQQHAQQAVATTTTTILAGGKQLVSSATSSPQPTRRSTPGSPAVQTKRDQPQQKVTDSPRLRRAFLEPAPGLQQLQSPRSSTQHLTSAYPAFDLVPGENEPTDPDKMSTTWAQKQVERFTFDFDRADKDKSGALSLAEVVEVLKAVGFKGTEDEAKAIFSHLDKNKDDRISRSEFKACCDKLPRMTIREFCYRKAFKQLDKDGSGYLTKAELIDALEKEGEVKLSANLISDNLIYITKEDDDGKIAYDEFLKILNFEESASVLNQIFRRLDKDGSGSLTLNEINDAISAEGELSKMKPRLVQLLKGHGGDPTKKINYHEFVAAWLKEKAKK